MAIKKKIKKVTILIAEDHALLRETWSYLLNSHAEFSIVGEAKSGEEAIGLAKEVRPDVILMDINLPGINGIEATEQVLIHSPESKVLGVSFHTQPAYAHALIQKGALGYITKNTSVEEMGEAIREVSKGNKYFSREIKESMDKGSKEGENAIKGINSLSRREIEVIGLIKKGHTSKEIAELLGITPGTIEVHRYNIFKKLKIKNMTALIEFINNSLLEFTIQNKKRKQIDS